MSIDNIPSTSSMPLYEREVQEYLSANLALLGNPLLTLIDVEHRVSFGGVEGRIDILARDKHGTRDSRCFRFRSSC